MWPMTSCSTKCCRKRWCTWSMIGEASGISSRARPSISSAISSPARRRASAARARRGGRGAPRRRRSAHRLPVDAHELQEGDEREAGGQHGRGVAQHLHVVVGEVLARRRAEAHRREDPLDQRGLQAGVGARRPASVAAPSAPRSRPRRSRSEPAASLAALICSSVWPARAQPRDHARHADRAASAPPSRGHEPALPSGAASPASPRRVRATSAWLIASGPAIR